MCVCVSDSAYSSAVAVIVCGSGKRRRDRLQLRVVAPGENCGFCFHRANLINAINHRH